MFKTEFLRLKQNGITKTAFQRLGDPDVIPLWFGEGDLATPALIRDEAKIALDSGETFYGHTRGKVELRAAISDYVHSIYNIDIEDERITVPGSSMSAITLACQMTLSKSDHALIVSPHWPNIDRAIHVTGAEYSCVRQLQTKNGWQLVIEDVRKSVRKNTKAIYINSPSNPTGWVMSREQQHELLEFCRSRQITIIADEVYHRTIYGINVAPSFLEIALETDPLIVVNGFSKAFAMTGWRLGWMITPASISEQMATLSECYNTSAPAFIQSAGVKALAEGENIISELRDNYAIGRDIVMEKLGSHPLIQLTTPVGAFYAFPKIIGLSSSEEFANSLLHKENVGVAPGYTFGPGNDKYIRLCFAQSHTKLKEALDRIIKHIEYYTAQKS